jgi:hypothetical protein
MNEIPSSVYVIIGTLIVANLGTVVTVIYGVGKLVWWMAKLDSRLAAVEVEHTKDIDSAHTKIRDLEKLNYNTKGSV